MEWLDGVAIIGAVLIVGGVTALNNYKSEQQFRLLQAKQDDALVIVHRDNVVSQVNVGFPLFLISFFTSLSQPRSLTKCPTRLSESCATLVTFPRTSTAKIH